MPKITNKATGKKETVTAEQLKAIQENKLISKNFYYEETEEPKEVKDLKEKDQASAPSKGAASKSATDNK